jgi:hypothetical protein
VTLSRLNGTVLGHGTVSNGAVRITFTNTSKTGYSVHLVYAGDANYTSGQSGSVRVKIKR